MNTTTGVRIVTRREWGASPLKTPASHDITPEHGGVAIHWAGGPVGITFDDSCEDHCYAMVRRFQREHIQNKGWVDLAYTELGCVHGTRFEARGAWHRTAANGTTQSNQNWYAVCALVGTGDQITPELLGALRASVFDLRAHGGAADGLTGHRDHFATACPGEQLYAWLKHGMPPALSDANAPTQPPYPGELHKPMTGTHVRQWQNRLRRLGYNLGAADGIFGPRTEAATERFQSRNGIKPVNGRVTVATWGAAW